MPLLYIRQGTGSVPVLPCYPETMPELMSPSLLYEDNHLLVVVKPPGVPSQPGRTATPDMLGLLKRDLALRHGKPGRVFLGLVHRLDQPTSGIMVFARTSKAASRLSKAFRGRAVKKTYLAVTRAIPDQDKGTFKDWLSRKEIDGRVRVGEGPGRYEAELSWQLLAREEERGEALLLIDLVTGRRHQIRAQMAAHGLPLLGDRRYGLMDGRDQEMATVALHACGLSFPHPTRQTQMVFWQGPDVNPSFSGADRLAFTRYLESRQREG